MFRHKTLATIQALLRNHAGEVEVFCAHDRTEFAQYGNGHVTAEA